MVGCPHIVHPLYIHMPPVHLYTPHTFVCAPRGVHNPTGAPMLSVLLHGFGALHVVGGVFLLNVYWDTPPLFGGASPLITPPTLHCWFSVHFYSQGYQFLCGPFPFYGRVWGCSPLHWGGWGAHQLFSCSHAHSYTFFFVEHYVSRVDHSSRLLLLQVQWYLLACCQCHQCQWLLP